MTDKVLEGCKKYIIKRVVNPSLYWMTKYERETRYKNERKDFVYLSARDVKECTGSRKIPVGELIAVKDDKKFLEGVVMDSYNRNSVTEYMVLLLEDGKVIGVKQSNIYCIKNDKSRNKKLNIVKVVVHGIQPAAVEIHENNLLGGIFQKSVCSNWSASAFQFVRDLVLRNPCVFVKAVHKGKSMISGEIYFLQEPESNGVPVNLGQILCAEGFAVSCDAGLKLMTENDMKGGSGNNIEEKIPVAALFRETQNDEVEKKFIVENVKSSENRVSDLMEGRIFSMEFSRTLEMQSGSSTSSSTCVVSENENSESHQCPTFNSSSDDYSSSCTLKKYHCNASTPSSGKSFKGENIYESEQTKYSSPKSPKVSTFRVIQRSLELFDKEKQHERFCHD